ncbi:hypothetical protein HNQ64_001452 [Prosthecobacter dejongeii]|uniref:Uncharacterized protein n=1 Tax=Prosthecobacter dejongeii TaxID=48465 RepID=A0A7W7YJ59_9BACT|nr:hypothetical protein [Prosthecobacter dejongeii]
MCSSINPKGVAAFCRIAPSSHLGQNLFEVRPSSIHIIVLSQGCSNLGLKYTSPLGLKNLTANNLRHYSPFALSPKPKGLVAFSPGLAQPWVSKASDMCSSINPKGVASVKRGATGHRNLHQ